MYKNAAHNLYSASFYAACPAGTYKKTSSPGDISSCISCPDVNQVSLPGSTSLDQCLCKPGFQKVGKKCVGKWILSIGAVNISNIMLCVNK